MQVSVQVPGLVQAQVQDVANLAQSLGSYLKFLTPFTVRGYQGDGKAEAPRTGEDDEALREEARGERRERGSPPCADISFISAVLRRP